MSNALASIALVGVASIFQGTFGLGMKYVRPLAWEAWWLCIRLWRCCCFHVYAPLPSCHT